MHRTAWSARVLPLAGMLWAAAGCMPNKNLADLDRRLAEEHDRLDAFAARQHAAPCADPEGCSELMRERCAAAGPFWVPAGVVAGGAAVAWDCVFDGEGQAEWARTQPFAVADGASPQATCDQRRGEHEIAFVAPAQDPGMVYCVFYEGEGGQRPTRCPEGQSPEECKKAEETACWNLRHERTREQFSYMTTERLPVDRPVRVSVRQALGDHGVGELGHFVVADCGLEDDEEYTARRQPPRDANCLDYAACRFHAKERKDARAWEIVEEMRRREARGSSAPRAGATRETREGDDELREGLWVYDLACTAEPDAGACASKTTICFTRSSGRLVGRVAQRSTVLKDNGVPVHTRKYDLDADTLAGTAVVVLPHVGTACKAAAYHETPGRATRVPAGPLGSIHIEYQDHRRDDGTCVLVPGETRTDILYKATAGDSSCNAIPTMTGPTWVPDPVLRGGGVN